MTGQKETLQERLRNPTHGRPDDVSAIDVEVGAEAADALCNSVPAPSADVVERAKTVVENWLKESRIADVDFPGIGAQLIVEALSDSGLLTGGKEGWMPIESAPKSETPIDLWVRSFGPLDSEPQEYRIPNAHREYAGGTWPESWIDSRGHYVNGFKTWDSKGERFTRGNAVPENARSWTIVTHWMPLPAAPLPADKQGAE